jgi:REase_AHJR-like
MSALASVEREALDVVESQLAGENYRFVRNPGPKDLPDFLRDAEPDAIALGGPPNLVIEVLNPSAARGLKLNALKVERLRASLSGHSDWRLEVVYARTSAALPSGASAEQIRRRHDEVGRLATIEPSGALLLAWGLLEAVMRALEPQRADRALTPGALIELLIGLGYLDEADGRTLRSRGNLRNAIAHGDLSTPPPTAADVQGVLDLVDKLARLMEPAGVSPTSS